MKRTLFGFKLSEITKATGLAPSVVWRHIVGERKISAEIAIKYHKALGVPLSEIRPDLWPPEQKTQAQSGSPYK